MARVRCNPSITSSKSIILNWIAFSVHKLCFFTEPYHIIFRKLDCIICEQACFFDSSISMTRWMRFIILQKSNIIFTKAKRWRDTKEKRCRVSDRNMSINWQKRFRDSDKNVWPRQELQQNVITCRINIGICKLETGVAEPTSAYTIPIIMFIN